MSLVTRLADFEAWIFECASALFLMKRILNYSIYTISSFQINDFGFSMLSVLFH